MKTLGIHFGSHDTSAALVLDGTLVAMMEEERFSHSKHTKAFPHEAIAFCLDQAGLTIHDLDVVAYGSDATLNNRYKNEFIEAAYPDAHQPALSDQKRIERHILDELSARWGDISPKFFFTDHHSAHAASVYYLSPFDESAIFTVDGMGNWVTTTFAHGDGIDLQTIRRVAYPHSLGLFYGAVTQFLGFSAACDEGKTMGLAPYGKPRFADLFRSMCKVEDGEICLDLNFFDMHKDHLLDSDGHPHRWYSDELITHLGNPREPESKLTDYYTDIACSAQLVLEERCYELLNFLHKETKSDNVCVAGGVALNCSMNGKISSRTAFKNVFVIPAGNDAGISIGAALLANRTEDPASFKRTQLRHAYYGSSHSLDEIKQALIDIPNGIIVSKPDDLSAAVADCLEQFEVVGWYQGRMEFGPRALGNRSILANPTRADSKDVINQKVKFRENFRPFAPVVPLEEADDYFEIDGETPFMLKITSVKSNKRDVIPAVTHVDGSARVQTVVKEQNQLIHELLYTMKERTGVPVLLNTSFNIRGDTIVRTPEDALKCFLGTGMHSVAIGPYLLRKSES